MFANNHTCSRTKSCSEIKILFGNKNLFGNANLFANKYTCSRIKPVREQLQFPNKCLSRTTLYFRPKFVREQNRIREQGLVREQLFLQSSFPNKNSFSNKSENKAIHEQKLDFSNKIINFRTDLSFHVYSWLNFLTMDENTSYINHNTSFIPQLHLTNVRRINSN